MYNFFRNTDRRAKLIIPWMIISQYRESSQKYLAIYLEYHLRKSFFPHRYKQNDGQSELKSSFAPII